MTCIRIESRILHKWLLCVLCRKDPLMLCTHHEMNKQTNNENRNLNRFWRMREMYRTNCSQMSLGEIMSCVWVSSKLTFPSCSFVMHKTDRRRRRRLCRCLHIKLNPYGRLQKYSESHCKTSKTKINRTLNGLKSDLRVTIINLNSYRFFKRKRSIEKSVWNRLPSPQKRFNGIKQCTQCAHRAQMNSRHWIMSNVPRTNEITATKTKTNK